ncbi:MAG: NADPH:quinone reductase-like Zn-dependent oxidoreductase, partial [Patiriisocius sp.]
GRIKPIIDSIYPLEQVEQAHGHMEGGQHMGKIIIKI